MEQRRLRLGDILDDYCPRERRVTNHAVVAMIGEDVKQTRCTTCDAEHAFKGAREPRRRKKDAPSVLYREVLAGLPEAELAIAGALPADAASLVVPAITPAEIAADVAEDAEELEAMTESNDDEREDVIDAVVEDETAQDDEDAPPVEEGPVHRRLIRATLPRPEGAVKEPRQIPEFTMRANPRGSFRGGMFRGNGGSGNGSNGNGNGHANRGSGRRFAGGGPSRGGGGGFRGGGNNPQRPGGGGGKKRSR
jgi:hypothetical protein